MSRPVPLGLWFNGKVMVTGRHSGFPKFRARLGSFPIPSWLGRPLVETGLWLLRHKGVRIPPLAEVVGDVRIVSNRATAMLRLPRRGGIVSSVASLQGAQVDADLARTLYCRLAQQNLARPSDELVTHLRRIFAPAAGHADAVTYNRAAFLAVALFVVGERADDLAPPGLLQRIKGCRTPAQPIQLSSRADLAKHWTMSAALTALLGDNAGRALGEWKELSDALADGTGFSFVDLTADRSGVRTGRLGVAPQTARGTAARLAKIEEPALVPLALMAQREGLAAQDFAARYGSIQQARYKEAVAIIDRALEQADAQPR